MTKLPTEPVQRLIAKYEQRISKLEEVNGALCAEINRQEHYIRQLESVIRDFYDAWCFCCDPWEEGFKCEHYDGGCEIVKRIDRLGLEVES